MKQINASSLATVLSSKPTPVLTWFEPLSAEEKPRERVELSGPVARRWLAKTDNFLDSEFPYGGETFTTLLPAHWRAPFWVMTPWLRGMALQPPKHASDFDLVVSNDTSYLESVFDEGGPDALIAQTLDSFALQWPGDLPGGLLDGTADILSYGDEVEMPYTAPLDSLLVADHLSWLPPGLWSDTGKQHMRLGDLGQKDYLGIGGSPKDWQRLKGERVLLTDDNLVAATAAIIQLWFAEASVVWVPGGGPDVAQIAETEKVTLTLPKPN